MRIPLDLPPLPRFQAGAFYAARGDYLEVQQETFADPVRCAACCIGRSGFAACVARCLATGQACDGGLRNCTPC